MPSDHISLNLRVEFEALTVSGDDIEILLTNILDANLAEGTSPIPETLKYTFLGEPVVGVEDINLWQIHATRTFKAQIPDTQAVNLTLGLSTTMAKQRLLDSLPLNYPPQLVVTPDWWPRMPLLPFRVKVIQE